jgi:hypothetical protein
MGAHHHDDAEGLVNQAIHAHDVGRAHAHHDHGLLLQRSAGAGIHLVQLLDRHVEALPLRAIHRPERSAADWSAHGQRRRALDVGRSARGELVRLERVPALPGSSLARLDERRQLRLPQERLH